MSGHERAIPVPKCHVPKCRKGEGCKRGAGKWQTETVGGPEEREGVGGGEGGEKGEGLRVAWM